ncbi:MAG: ATP-binding protein [Pseudonocardia sp.]|nr:ATP-binding protein [Pseudonocardia sp.]
MIALTDPAAEAAIGAACHALHLPTIRVEAARIAAAAARERLSHKAFLTEVLTAECDDRDSRRRTRRVNEAKFPRSKRLENFDLHAHPSLPPATLAHLAGGAWIDAGEPVVLLGDSGTGKTHLLIGLGQQRPVLRMGPHLHRPPPRRRRRPATFRARIIATGTDSCRHRLLPATRHPRREEVNRRLNHAPQPPVTTGDRRPSPHERRWGNRLISNSRIDLRRSCSGRWAPRESRTPLA